MLCGIYRDLLGTTKHLTNSIMLGYPEVSITGYPGKLLTDGIYGKIQHPRYVQIQLGFIGYALITNFQGVYIMTIILILNLYLIVLLEEKELINRFGDVYAEYSKSVPRFIPKQKNING